MYFNNFFKCSVVLFGVYQLASAATFRCYYTFSNHIDAPIDDPKDLYISSNPCWDLQKKTSIVAIGYNFLLEGPLLTALIAALLSLGDRNVVLVNWQKEASSNLPAALGYPPAVANCKKVGEAVGNSLAKLMQNAGLNPDITFIGHSLGAHLAGFAGTQSSSKGFQLPVIVALDPARVLYEFPSSIINKPVDKSCAKFVYVVHCDEGGYGINKTLGHVDFWPNFGNYDSSSSSRLQPGCPEPTTDEEKASHGSRCSHDYCWRFYNISLTSPSLFEGGKANNYYDFLRKNGNFDVTNFIGPLVDSEKTGDFFFNTDDTYPWGRAENGLFP